MFNSSFSVNESPYEKRSTMKGKTALHFSNVLSSVIDFLNK